MDGDFQLEDGSYFDDFQLPDAGAGVAAGLVAAAELAAAEVGVGASAGERDEAAAGGRKAGDQNAATAAGAGEQETAATGRDVASGSVDRGSEETVAPIDPAAVARRRTEEGQGALALIMEESGFQAGGDFVAAAADPGAAVGYDFNSSAAFVRADYGEIDQLQEVEQKRYYGDSGYSGAPEGDENERGGGCYVAPSMGAAGVDANWTEQQQAASPAGADSRGGAAGGSAPAGAKKQQHVGMVNGYSNDASFSPAGAAAASSSTEAGFNSSNNCHRPAAAGIAADERGKDDSGRSGATVEDDAVDAAARQAVEALRLQMQQEVEARRTGEAQLKKEQRELAQEELHEFYERRKQQIERRRKANQ